MTDNICDSWEDVDVDRVVIKSTSKLKSKPAASAAAAAAAAAATGTTNLSFNSPNNNADNQNDSKRVEIGGNTANASANSTFKILQRNINANVPNNHNASSSTISNRQEPISYSAIAATGIISSSSSLSASPFVSSSSSASCASSASPSSASSQPFVSTLSCDAPPFEYPRKPTVTLEDNSRTQFVAKLRILNRPNAARDPAAARNRSRTSEQIKQQLIKSFEEKQAEYAKARLRILGEEMIPVVANLNLDDMTQSNATHEPQQVKNSFSSANSICNSANRKSSPSKTVASSAIKNKQPEVPPPPPIIREPVAPDGTRGFRYVRSE